MTSKDYRVGICGFGVVGKGIYKLLKDDVKAIYDPYTEVPDTVGSKKSDFSNMDLIVICVMTKELKDGSCDVSIVEDSIKWAHTMSPKAVILIKSAIVPGELKRISEEVSGTLGRLRLVCSPEYMGESKYFTPFWKYPDPTNMESHPWQVFGGEKEDTSLCVDIFKRRMSVDTMQLQTTLMTAALCKYAENTFFALKVTFCNEWYDIAKAYGVDYNELRECWLADTRINRNHTLVFPKDRGYGGKCFPKDVKAIINDAGKAGVDAELMKAVDKVNERIRGAS
jgi:UDPglucose 6-dehydrogenase